MSRFGLIGHPLSHSKSKVFFEELFAVKGLNGYSYENFPLESEDEVRNFIQHGGNLRGLNVTSPYKQLAFHLCDSLSDEASATGSVNCIHFESGRIIGYNTDVYGFVKSIEQLLVKTNELIALILGSGGAASAAIYGLGLMGIQSKVIGRGANKFFLKGYADLSAEELSSFHIIVNATPLGTWPNIDSFPPIPYEAIHSGQVLFDMVYNPAVTAFMRYGMAAGCRVKNGSEMLHLQALKSWEIWTEKIEKDY